MSDLAELRLNIRQNHLRDDDLVLADLQARYGVADARSLFISTGGDAVSVDIPRGAALTAKAAQTHFDRYADAINQVAAQRQSGDIRESTSVSIRLSALHPRYEVGQRDRVMTELPTRVLALANMARNANVQFNIDAERTDLLDLSLDVLEVVLSDSSLAGWDGFGVVVQAHCKRASWVIDWLYAFADQHDRKITVRLVRGADRKAEIERAHAEGMSRLPVYAHYEAIEVSYQCCATQLSGLTNRIDAQFVSHDAESSDQTVVWSAFERRNSKGWDLHNFDDLAEIEEARAPFEKVQWRMGPITVGEVANGEVCAVQNPAAPGDLVGLVQFATREAVDLAIKNATIWDASASTRSEILNKAADLYEAHFGTFFALLAREAGKTLPDVVVELREAVDFLRYYAARTDELTHPDRGILTCISPWNSPLAIFTDQIAAALSAGSGVLAKPAESTSLTSLYAAQLMLEAGVPVGALQVLTGEGADVGSWLTQSDKVNGVYFTGSIRTAQVITQNMAVSMPPAAPFISKASHPNVLIVDSTAELEKAVRDVIASAYRSTGQRCDALRVLYIEDSIADTFLTMLYGAIDELIIGNPWHAKTDIGPLINASAKAVIEAHVNPYGRAGRVLKHVSFPADGYFVPPCVIAIDSISDLKEEVFGPILHVARFRATDLEQVIADVNANDFNMTSGAHSSSVESA